jgi:hypothetical protein
MWRQATDRRIRETDMDDAHEHHTHDPYSHAHHAHEPHAHEKYSDRPHPEFVVLEIGDDLGALIVYTDPAMHGSEIEISPAGDDDARSHKDVLERSLGGRPAFSAVFDQIREGRYTLWVDDAPRARDVQIAGGQVAELDWRLASQPA